MNSIAGLQVTSRRPCWWSRTKAFLSAGKWTLFWCKFSRKISFVLTTNMAALSRGCKPRINWPASSIWVFIAQLGEHCNANAEATGSNPVEAPKNVFSGYFRNCLNCDSLRWSHTHFICIPAVHIISFSVSFLSRVDELNKLASLQYMGLHSSAGRALQR